MSAPSVPKCGASDQRNSEYERVYTPQLFFSHLVTATAPVIFDVGAHCGESIRFFKEIFPDARVYSFEPDPDNFEILKAAATAHTDCLAYNLAVAEKTGSVKFYRQDISHLGGLLPINCESKDSLGYAAKAKNASIDIPAVTLDAFCQKEGVGAVDVLKIDVQGYEIGVLQGARGILPNTGCCSVEVSLYDFYAKSSSLLEVETIMHAAGLLLWDISKISKNPKNLRTDWVELVYRNKK